MNEWRTVKLEDCLETLIDYRGKTPDKKSFGIPLITAKIVKAGRIETPWHYAGIKQSEKHFSFSPPTS